MIKERFASQKGFSLIEIMVVLAIMGIIMTAVYTFYLTQQKTSLAQEDIVEVQQNLRVAMDSINRDIRMAGFMIASGTNPVASYTNGASSAADSITINTASAAGAYTWLNADNSPMTVTAGSDITLSVADSSNFSVEATRQIVRIVNPLDKAQPLNTTYTVEGAGTTAATCGAVTPPCLVLKPANDGVSITYSKGYVVARTGKVGTDSYPNTIAYSLSSASPCPTGQTCLIKNTQANGNQVMATNIKAGGTGLQFRYLLNDGTESDAPADLSQVRAIRVTVNGETTSENAEINNVAQERSMTTVIDIRNRQ